MAALPPDYDSDPERWRSMDASWQVFGDVHEPVAERLADLGADPVIDIGGGQGRLVRALPAGFTGIVIDNSPAQLTDAFGPRILADALYLPLRDGCAGGVTALWMLYHLDEPDAPMTRLLDLEAVLRYCRSHHLPAEAAERVTPPVWLTKRGCLIYARR